jgi:hypothetical protein
MKKTAFLSIVAAVVIGFVLTSAWGQPDKPGGSAPATPFKGKVLFISCKGDSSGGGTLRNVSIKNFAGTEFMVGEEVSPSFWLAGHTVWISIADISHITEFKDLDEYAKAAKEFEATEEANQKRRADHAVEQLRRLREAGLPTKEKPDAQE